MDTWSQWLSNIDYLKSFGMSNSSWPQANEYNERFIRKFEYHMPRLFEAQDMHLHVTQTSENGGPSQLVGAA